MRDMKAARQCRQRAAAGPAHTLPQTMLPSQAMRLDCRCAVLATLACLVASATADTEQ